MIITFELIIDEKKRDSTKRYYNIFRFIVTVGSILLPAILSLGQMDPTKMPKHFDLITYWSSWSISLMVTISNGFLQLFSLDKNYFNYSLVVEPEGSLLAPNNCELTPEKNKKKVLIRFILLI